MMTHVDRQDALARSLVVARMVWAVLLAGAVVRVLCFASERQQGVYVLQEAAGRHWRLGEPVYPEPAGWGVFPYGPPTAVFFAPFSLLPQGLGNALWRVLVAGACWTALRRWARVGANFSEAQTGWLLLLVVPLLAPSLLNGQIGALVMALLLFAATAAIESRWSLSAVLTASAASIKVYPLAFGLLLGLAGPRRYAVRLALALLGVLLIPFLAQHATYVCSQYAGWFALLRSADGNPWYVDVTNRNVTLLARAIGWPIRFETYRLLQRVAAGAFAALVLATALRQRSRAEVVFLVAGLASLWMTLFGPCTESFTWVLVAPTLASLMLHPGQRQTWEAERLALGASWALFTAASVCVWVPGGTWILDHGPHPLAGSLLLGCLLAHLARNLAVPVDRPSLVAWLPRWTVSRIAP